MNNDQNSNPPQSEVLPPTQGGSAFQPAVEATSEVEAPPPPPATLPSPPQDDSPGPFVAGIDERCLWVDPLADDPRVKAGAVLLGDIIDHYVKSFNVLFDNTAAYKEGKLKGGSYTMTPDEDEACTFMPNREGGVEKKQLAKDRDGNGEYYVVPCNSLVYIRLKQRLRLPFYIIGRHNLKIRYVYKGLLLGTGPQVDPGFQGSLFIPLHNFTTSDVKVYITGEENPFVSIDFVRTTPLLDKTIPSAIRTVDDLRKYLEDSKSRVLIEKKKVERKRLEDYLGVDRPRSQLGHFQSNYQRFESDIRSEMASVKKWVGIERIAIFLTVGSLLVGVMGVLIATTNYFRGYVTELKAETKEIKALATGSEQQQSAQRISSLERGSIQSSSNSQYQFVSLAASYSAVSNNVAEVENRIKTLESLLTRFQTNLTGHGFGNPTKPQKD
jgi:hypothetical protein